MADIPEFIYHYTSQDAFLGIVNSKTLWATDILYLNDSAEFTYAVQLFCEVLEEYANDEKYETVQYLREGLTTVPYGVHFAAIYVASFSGDGDLLSQWRAYCPPGSGFSIAFHTSTLEQVIAPSRFQLVPCEYDENKQKQLIRQLLHKTFQQPGHGTALQFCAEHFFKIAPTLKHPTFEEEREWRLVSPLIDLSDPRVKYRSGKSMLIPYVELQITDDNKQLIIDHVTLAPTPHPRLAEGSVFRYLKTLYPSGKPESTRDLMTGFTRESKIPYRAW